MNIAIDAMGGDFAPAHEVLGAIEALRKDSSMKITLVGKKEVLVKELAKHGHFPQIEIVHAPDIITMHDSPTQALREKKQSSLSIAVQLLKEGSVDALVSAGNTGAVLACSIFSLGRIKNVERPAIVAVFPTLRKPLVILDIGANVDCKPKHLVQFAKMGSVFSEKVVGVTDPVVKLLNIGEEQEKGNELTLETYQLLKKAKDIRFEGNIEPKHLLDGDLDVVVCDGFVGNVILKFGEGATSMLFKMIKHNVKKNWLATIGAILMMPVLRQLKKRVEYDEFGGTLLLGVKKIIIITHGSASPKAICNGILEAKKAILEKVIERIEEVVSQTSEDADES
ncbi:MAG: phosphate acyltransferase PlsX [Candidatus Margulisiibacteriota bacterium]